MNIRPWTALIPILCLAGCASPRPAPPITEDQAFACAAEILRGRNAMPANFVQTVDWATNHWCVTIEAIDQDDNGQRRFIIGNHPRFVILDPGGHLLALLGGGTATPEETAAWEDNLRHLAQE
jgi:hypothetical protein